VHNNSDSEESNFKIRSSEKIYLSKIQSELNSNLSERGTLSLLDDSPLCTKILDLDFNLQYMSTAGIKSLQIDNINSLYGKPYPFYFYPKSFRDDMIKNLNKAVRSNKTVKQESNVVDLKGNELWYHSTIIPIEDKNSCIKSILIISIDSTSSNKAKLALEKYKEVEEYQDIQQIIASSINSSKINFMSKVTNIVLANMSDSNFDVNVLAARLFMSRSTLQRKLTKATGISAALFIRQRRLAKAHQFIQGDVHKTLAETAFAVGFKHPGYFSKLYKEYVITIKEEDTSLTENIHSNFLNQNNKTFYDNILSEGLNAFALTLGIISHIENNLYKIVAVISEQNLFIPGEAIQLCDTYCHKVIENDKTLTLTQFNVPPLCPLPFYNKIPLESYISTPIYKNGKVWGTLNFSSQHIKDEPFRSNEISLIETLAKQISATL